MSVHSFKELEQHIGHDIVCAGYAWRNPKTGKKSDWENVSIECETCNEVLMSYNQPTNKKYEK